MINENPYVIDINLGLKYRRDAEDHIECVYDTDILEWNRSELRKIDPRLIGEERCYKSRWLIVRLTVDFFCNLSVFFNSNRAEIFLRNVERINSKLNKDYKGNDLNSISSKKLKLNAFSIRIAMTRLRKQQEIKRLQNELEKRLEDPQYVHELLYGDDDTLSLTDSTEGVQQTLEQAQLLYSEFFKAIPNFGEHFQKLFDEKLTLPEGAKVTEIRDTLTIKLPAVKLIRLDPGKELSQEQFDALNRNANTEGLTRLNQDPNKNWEQKKIPSKASNPVLCIKNLTYFGAFGAGAAKDLVNGKVSEIGNKLVMQRSGNLITFVEGGPKGLKSIEFLPGYEDWGGLVKVNVAKGFVSGSDVYFGNDFRNFFELGKVT